MKLWNKIKNHYKEKSKLSIISDIIFYLFILALIFTPSRNFIISHLQRIIMFSPKTTKKEIRLQAKDWSWIILNKEGQKIYLANFRGKVILINFWATWCAPCLAELPALQDLYNHFKNHNDIVFLFITTENLDKAHSFLVKKGYNLPIYQQIFPAPPPLYSNTIPSTYLIDKQGNIIIEVHRAKRWNSDKTISLINKLLNQK